MTALRCPFVVQDPNLGAISSAPLLPIVLEVGAACAVSGLLDTGAMVSVLPYSVGVKLGADWGSQATRVRLSGTLAAVEARALLVRGTVGSFPPVRLAFAWAQTDTVPLLLGQINFFQEFDVCFFRATGVFEVRPHGGP